MPEWKPLSEALEKIIKDMEKSQNPIANPDQPCNDALSANEEQK